MSDMYDLKTAFSHLVGNLTVAAAADRNHADFETRKELCLKVQDLTVEVEAGAAAWLVAQLFAHKDCCPYFKTTLSDFHKVTSQIACPSAISAMQAQEVTDATYMLLNSVLPVWHMTDATGGDA
jgi:hypothetical protein